MGMRPHLQPNRKVSSKPCYFVGLSKGEEVSKLPFPPCAPIDYNYLPWYFYSTSVIYSLPNCIPPYSNSCRIVA